MVSFKDLPQVFLRKAVKYYDQRKYREAYELIEPVNEDELKKLDSDDGIKLSHLFYLIGKLRFSEKNYPTAHKLFNKSLRLKNNILLAERIRLLISLKESISDKTRKSLEYDAFCGKLGVISQECTKASNQSCLRHLECYGAISPSSFQLTPKVRVLYLGAYRPRERGDKWSTIIRKMKDELSEDYSKAIVSVLVEFLLDLNKDVVQGIDLIVPVPPNPGKYTGRGFAPTDLLVKYLSKGIAVPVRYHLIRTNSGNTREASESEMKNWYFLKTEGITFVKGNHVLLVDDVSTRGNTLKVCSNLLLESGADKVTCLILGQTGG